MHFAKLRLTSCPAWSLVNGQELSLKALSTGRFLLISLDGKRGEDGRLEKKRVKVREASFEDVFLIVLRH